MDMRIYCTKRAVAHDTTLREHPKAQYLRARFGMKVYGLWLEVLEMLAASEAHRMPWGLAIARASHQHAVSEKEIGERLYVLSHLGFLTCSEVHGVRTITYPHLVEVSEEEFEALVNGGKEA